MESERAANKYKQVEYMQNYLGDEFEGVISGVAAFGFWVETVEHKCEGLVSINSLLEYDDFRHIETDYSLVGRRSGRQFRMGDKIMIKVIAANLTKRQLDYEWVITAAEKNAPGAMVLPLSEDGPAPIHKKGVRGGHGKKGGAERGKGQKTARHKPSTDGARGSGGGTSAKPRRKKP
jgi:ribonuclease R